MVAPVVVYQNVPEMEVVEEEEEEEEEESSWRTKEARTLNHAKKLVSHRRRAKIGVRLMTDSRELIARSISYPPSLS